MSKKEFPSLGFCNVVISQQDANDTKLALGFPSENWLWDQATQTYLVRRLKNQPWYGFETSLLLVGHPVDVPHMFFDILQHYRSPKLTPKGKKRAKATNGVVLCCHRIEVIDLVWALQHAQRAIKKRPRQKKRVVRWVADMLAELGVVKTKDAVDLSKWALNRTFKILYLGKEGAVKDISRLNLTSDDEDEASWGHIFDVGEACGSLVRRCANLDGSV